MKHVRVVSLLGLGPRNSKYPHYTAVFYEDEAGRRTLRPVPLPFLQALHALSGEDAFVSLVVLGTPEVRAKWIDTGDLKRVVKEYLPAPLAFEFIEVPSGDPDADQPGEVSAAARFVEQLLPCLLRKPLDRATEEGWEQVDEVVFDVTNGFRAQSVLATTAIVAAVEDAARRGEEPALRVQYGAFDKCKDDVAPVWNLTGMVTQQAWVRAIDSLVTSARADAFDALCKDLAAERIGTDYRNPDRRSEQRTLRGLGAAAKTLADDIVCARVHSVLTSSARAFCSHLAAAGPLISRHAPAASAPLERLGDLVRPMVCDVVVSEAGLHAQVALASACVETERYAVATSILREVLVCAWHLETCGDRPPWQPAVAQPDQGWDWRAVGASVSDMAFIAPDGARQERLDPIRSAFRALGDLRNDVQHAGLRSVPRSSKQVRDQTRKKLQACQDLLNDLFPVLPSDVGTLPVA